MPRPTTPQPTAVPLYRLAANRCLPSHQPMDQDTLSWIVANRPDFPEGDVLVLSRRSAVLIPRPGWFSAPRQAAGIHGVLHGARVSLLAGLLAEQQGLDHDQTTVLVAAAAVHDCRRRDDRDDPGHGARAATWFQRHQDAVLALTGAPTPCLRAVRDAATAISLHDVPYEHFTPPQDRLYRRSRVLVDLLRAADALDRYRLPAVRWWPDLDRLRVTVPTGLPQAAFDLMLTSEQARLDGATDNQALAHASRRLTTNE